MGAIRDMSASAPNGASLIGKQFVFTGKLSGMTRVEAASLVENRGGTYSATINGNTTYVVVGENAGATKLEEIRRRGITTLTEPEFLSLVGNGVLEQFDVGNYRHIVWDNPTEHCKKQLAGQWKAFKVGNVYKMRNGDRSKGELNFIIFNESGVGASFNDYTTWGFRDATEEDMIKHLEQEYLF